MLRSLNRLVTPTGGSVTSELGELGSGSALRQHRRRTAMIFQHHQLIERQSALANVLTGRLAFHNTLRSLFPLPRADQEIALSCLARVGLADKALSRVDKLSGGQQQRVGIARALAQQPAIILADEPVASLDPATSVRVLGLLRDICKEDGITAIVSLHQLEYARRFADRVVGLADSQIVFDAAPRNSPMRSLSASMQAALRLSQRILRLNHLSCSNLHWRCPDETLIRALIDLLAVRCFKFVRPSGRCRSGCAKGCPAAGRKRLRADQA